MFTSLKRVTSVQLQSGVSDLAESHEILTTDDGVTWISRVAVTGWAGGTSSVLPLVNGPHNVLGLALVITKAVNSGNNVSMNTLTYA